MTKTIETKYIGLAKRLLAFLVDLVLVTILMSLGLIIRQYLPILQNDTIGSFIVIVIPLLYFTILESSYTQASIGKMYLKIKVINKNGERLNLLQAFIRSSLSFVNYFIFGIGALLMLVTKKKQALQDLLVGSYVVEIEEYEQYRQNHQALLNIASTFIYILLALFILNFLYTLVYSAATSETGQNIIAIATLIGIGYLLSKFQNSSVGQSLSKMNDAYTQKREDQKENKKFEKEQEQQKQKEEEKTQKKQTNNQEKDYSKRYCLVHQGSSVVAWDDYYSLDEAIAATANKGKHKDKVVKIYEDTLFGGYKGYFYNGKEVKGYNF